MEVLGLLSREELVSGTCNLRSSTPIEGSAGQRISSRRTSITECIANERANGIFFGHIYYVVEIKNNWKQFQLNLPPENLRKLSLSQNYLVLARKSLSSSKLSFSESKYSSLYIACVPDRMISHGGTCYCQSRSHIQSFLSSNLVHIRRWNVCYLYVNTGDANVVRKLPRKKWSSH